MPRDFDFDFGDEDLGRPVRQQPPRQPRQPRQQMPSGGSMRDRGDIPARSVTSHRKKNDTRSIIILAVEIVVFIILLALHL